MKHTLVLIRHAKSSWATPFESDFDRSLNDRGKQDAPVMGAKLKALQLIPDMIISSTAKRTRQTAKRIAKEVGFDIDKIKWEEKLYHCIPSVFEEVIQRIDDKVKTVFIVAHNPGITDFVNELSPEFKIDNMPTCSVAAAHITDGEWSTFASSKKEVFLFEYPGKP